MTQTTFEQFDREMRSLGFDEVLEREWEPDLVLEQHAHPFVVNARVARGDFWLSVGGQTRHLQAGDAFELERGQPHAERYGATGATFWVARRHAL